MMVIASRSLRPRIMAALQLGPMSVRQLSDRLSADYGTVRRLLFSMRDAKQIQRTDNSFSNIWRLV